MENLDKILQFLHKIEKLKTIQRKISISDNSRKESPAEHTWRVGIMAMVLHRELKLDIDLLKALEIILVHDIVECVADDVWIIDQDDKAAHKIQKDKEMEAAHEIYGILPNEIGDELKSLWVEYENQISKEAKFAKALDKIEVIIQRTDLRSENWERKDILPILNTWTIESVANFPEVKEFWEKVKKELNEQVEMKK